MSQPREFDLLGRGDWAMMPGERAALEGILSALRPSLSIEIGTDKGGSLQLISAYSKTVHAFDLTRAAEVTAERFPNVSFHIGDSHELLPRVLEQFASAGQKVDFAFVDGDHTAAGVSRDMEDLLSSPSIDHAVILVHDTLNERVRAGLEHVDYAGFAKVRLVDLDFVQGRALRESGELWAGLGIVVAGFELSESAMGSAVYTAPEVYANLSASIRPDYDPVVEVEQELAEQREVLAMMGRSLSWRVTAPLRTLSRLLRRGSLRE
jgi:methyltransferase family protein